MRILGEFICLFQLILPRMLVFCRRPRRCRSSHQPAHARRSTPRFSHALRDKYRGTLSPRIRMVTIIGGHHVRRSISAPLGSQMPFASHLYLLFSDTTVCGLAFITPRNIRLVVGIGCAAAGLYLIYAIVAGGRCRIVLFCHTPRRSL